MSIRILQLQKRSSYEYKYIQDRYALNSTDKIFALADGTTQSFNSELWAEIITKNFVNNPIFEPFNLIFKLKEIVQTYKNVEFSFSTNPAKASLERAKQSKGGTATFIGLHLKEENKAEIISCGDTNLFLITPDYKIKTFPFSDINGIDSNNHFINTEVLLKDGIDETFFKSTSITYNNNDIIILATDALSRLLLKRPDTIKELLNIQSFENLLNLCLKKWESKELEEDDISAIIIPIGSTTDIKLICPPNEFQFPKEMETDFSPTILSPKIENPNSNMEMKEIKNQFDGVAKDMHYVKSKLNLHEILLIVTISLLMVNMLMMYLLRPKSNLSITDKTTNEIEKKYEKAKEEIQVVKNKITGGSNLDLAKKKKQVIETKTNNISKKEARKRQQELIKGGYKVVADGIWGSQSEKAWQIYQLKKEKK
jgi:serine/threonine protein phosphatase PrpC